MPLGIFCVVEQIMNIITKMTEIKVIRNRSVMICVWVSLCVSVSVCVCVCMCFVAFQTTVQHWLGIIQTNMPSKLTISFKLQTDFFSFHKSIRGYLRLPKSQFHCVTIKSNKNEHNQDERVIEREKKKAHIGK